MDTKANGKRYMNFPSGNFQKATTKKITSMCRRNNISLSLLCHNIQFLGVSLFVNNILKATLELSCFYNIHKLLFLCPKMFHIMRKTTNLMQMIKVESTKVLYRKENGSTLRTS